MAQLPAQIRCLMADDSGKAEGLHLVTMPTPKPGPGEVLVRVFAAGLNRADVLQRKGQYAVPEGVSPVLGLEAAGEVCSLGEGVERWRLGDAVMVLVAGGACAECVVVPEAHCLPVPENFSMMEAATTPEAAATVWANVFEDGRLREGETILIHGGASGIGTLGIQIVKAFGATSIVTVATEEKAEMCRKLGAALAINYKTQDFVKETMKFTKDEGVDVVLDMIGGDYINRNLQLLAPLGRHVSIAWQEGAEAEIDIRTLMRKNLTLMGSFLRFRLAARKAWLLREIELRVIPMMSAGKIKPIIYQSFPLEKAVEAHKCMESGQHIGKIVLTV